LIVTAILQAADRPRIRSVRKSLSDIIAMKFNLRQRFANNVSILQAKVARLSTYGITVPKLMIATVILAEANKAAREPWSRNIETAVAKLRRTYAYNHTHIATLVAAILQELVGADAVRNMMEVPAPNEPVNRAATVDKVMPHVQRLVFNSTTEDGTAASTTTGYRSKLSEETARPACSRSTKKRGDRERAKAREERKEHTTANNPYKHCRKWKQCNHHPQVK
jgi:hypothetical protein